ncbi:MAG: 5-formyltetrahydrofolate cyclo-ligase [bacterium]
MKKSLRKKILSLRKKMTSKEVKSHSNLIVQNIKNLNVYENSKTIAIYHPYKNEVDILSLLEDRNKFFCFPVVKKDSKVLCFRVVEKSSDLISGAYGIQEPASCCFEVAASDIDLFLTPGVAFSETGERLGYGGGYYDSTLPLRKDTAKAIGVAFDFQILSSGFYRNARKPIKLRP